MRHLIASVLCVLCLLLYSTAAMAVSMPTLGDERAELYLPLLKGKKVALLSNHTGIDRDSVHIVDKLLAAGVDVEMLLSPEHGFRGTADAGAKVAGGIDAATGLPIVSLYGGKSADIEAGLKDVDVIVTDLQDVGLRFYTYYISMLRMMNLAARQGKEFVVLDRPNPNGMSIDGPVLDMSLASGVGKLPLPVLHGLTLGEMAKMINGEGWLDEGRTVALEVVPMLGYEHSQRVPLLNMPSPNLKSMHAIYLYPSTCLFEGTHVSLGRGTDHPFEVYGHPAMTAGDYRFTPRSMAGAANPPQLGKRCRGRDLRGVSDDEAIAQGVNLAYIIDAYRHYPDKDKFFTPFFDKLIGDKNVSRMIKQGKSAEQIKQTWADGLNAYKSLRAKYLLYPD